MTTENAPKEPKRPTWKLRYREVVNENEYELMGAYVAGVIDSSGSLTVRVQKASDRSVGYMISPMISIQRHQEEIINVIDNWCMEHGIQASIRETETEKGTQLTFELRKRDDLKRFLENIQPFVIVKHNAVEIILCEIIPRLEERKISTKEGFLETMEYVDMVRESTSTTANVKYDTEFFRNEWADDL